MNEIWVSPDGFACYLEAQRWDGPSDWYPEERGQRPPQRYCMIGAASGVIRHDFVVFPIEPWSPYDAAHDLLVREGWTPPPPTEEELATCEHGLSAWLCAGPGHYPPEREW